MIGAQEQGSSRKRLYVGRAGQMAVMAEFLWRGWSIPTSPGVKKLFERWFRVFR